MLRRQHASFLIAITFLAGCGYVGPVVPPSPLIPVVVIDLSVVERGDQLIASFPPPVNTTDNVSITDLSNVEMRISQVGDEAAGRVYQIPAPPQFDPNQFVLPITYSTGVADWVGKHVSIQVRTSVKKDKNYSAWSKPVTMEVIAPLAAPVIAAEATAAGYKLTWSGEGKGVDYVVMRKGPTDGKPVEIGTADNPEYVDGTAVWSTPYTYQVMAREASAESLLSNAVEVNHADTFPPAVPAGLTGVATPDSIELSWERDTEPDLKGYYLYRSVDGGPFQKLGDLLVLPAYSDHAVEHGKTYAYKINAIDQVGNVSALSAPISVAVP